MMKTTYYGAFNARWMPPEEVARRFVPLPSFSRLVRAGHSVLMGPRGCGKTTLLKMLTRRALREWRTSEKPNKYRDAFYLPAYESIYIPSDVRWLSEVRDISLNDHLDAKLCEQVQRVMISASVVSAAVDAFRVILDDSAIGDGDKRRHEDEICTCLIRLWSLKLTVPSFKDIENKIEDLVVRIRGALNSADSGALTSALGDLPPVLYAHSFDAAIQCCKRVTPSLPEDVRPEKWAICYDELEISPEWLHRELLSSLRSIDQSFFLKLTWNPIFPRPVTAPEPGADFTVVRLWNSHVQDPVQFCEDLTRAFMAERFPGVEISPDAFLGRSVFASEETAHDNCEYERGSPVYKAMKNLAENDGSFREALSSRGIAPNDPVPSAEPSVRARQMDEFFRKAKPIVLLRQAFLNLVSRLKCNEVEN